VVASTGQILIGARFGVCTVRMTKAGSLDAVVPEMTARPTSPAATSS
jgi:hypothetical protein